LTADDGERPRLSAVSADRCSLKTPYAFQSNGSVTAAIPVFIVRASRLTSRCMPNARADQPSMKAARHRQLVRTSAATGLAYTLTASQSCITKISNRPSVCYAAPIRNTVAAGRISEQLSDVVKSTLRNTDAAAENPRSTNYQSVIASPSHVRFDGCWELLSAL